MQVIVRHGDHGVGDVELLLAEALVDVLLQGLAQLLDDELGVGDLLAVVLHEGQHATLGTELAIVVDILKKEKRNTFTKMTIFFQGCYNIRRGQKIVFVKSFRVV